MKSELPPPEPPREGVRRLAPVEPRLVEVRLDDDEARGAAVLALVLEPAMSLNRLVVPRVAPMLEAPLELLELLEVLDPLNAEAVPDDDDELEVPVLELESPPELPELAEPPEPPPEPPPEKDRPRSLRLPRICGAITVENFCAWTVPVMRIVRRRSPIAILAVRIMVVEVFPVEELARLVFQ
jgi:hypothetical protein